MFESPFYVDKPWPIGIFCTLMSVALIVCYFRYKRQGGIHAIITTVMRFTGNPPENHDKVTKILFSSLAALFAVMGVYSLCIALGVIRNKPQLTVQEMKQMLERFEQQHQHLPKRDVPGVTPRPFE